MTSFRFLSTRVRALASAPLLLLAVGVLVTLIVFGLAARQPSTAAALEPPSAAIPVHPNTPGSVGRSVEALEGSAGNDTLIGDNRANTLSARGGNDTLLGRGGNDRLVGGGGNDRLIGGSGRDSEHR